MKKGAHMSGKRSNSVDLFLNEISDALAEDGVSSAVVNHLMQEAELSGQTEKLRLGRTAVALRQAFEEDPAKFLGAAASLPANLVPQPITALSDERHWLQSSGARIAAGSILFFLIFSFGWWNGMYNLSGQRRMTADHSIEPPLSSPASLAAIPDSPLKISIPSLSSSNDHASIEVLELGQPIPASELAVKINTSVTRRISLQEWAAIFEPLQKLDAEMRAKGSGDATKISRSLGEFYVRAASFDQRVPFANVDQCQVALPVIARMTWPLTSTTRPNASVEAAKIQQVLDRLNAQIDASQAKVESMKTISQPASAGSR